MGLLNLAVSAIGRKQWDGLPLPEREEIAACHMEKAEMGNAQLGVSQEGQLRIQRGLIRKEDMKKLPSNKERREGELQEQAKATSQSRVYGKAHAHVHRAPHRGFRQKS